MKNIKRFISAALIAMLLLTLSSAALADDTTVFIPGRLLKLDLPDRPSAIKLTTTNDKKNNIEFQFSEKPDSAIINWFEGPEIMDVDDSGYYITSRDGHILQPGAVANNSDEKCIIYPDQSRKGVKILRYTCDPLTGKIYDRMTDELLTTREAQALGIHTVSGDNAYVATKGNVTATYDRGGKVIEIVLKTNEDYFKTGMEGAEAEITFTYFKQHVLRDKAKNKWGYDSGYYVSSVAVNYPAGNYIARVQTDWRNDENNTLASYRITYATSDKEKYEIIYAPATGSVLQSPVVDLTTGETIDTNFRTSFKQRVGYDLNGNPIYETVTIPANAPDKKIDWYYDGYTQTPTGTQGTVYVKDAYIIHHDKDEVLGGFYYRGKTILSAGSGKNLKKWYKWNGTTEVNGVIRNNNGKQYSNSKYGLKPCTSFPSPRVE